MPLTRTTDYIYYTFPYRKTDTFKTVVKCNIIKVGFFAGFLANICFDMRKRGQELGKADERMP